MKIIFSRHILDDRACRIPEHVLKQQTAKEYLEKLFILVHTNRKYGQTFILKTYEPSGAIKAIVGSEKLVYKEVEPDVFLLITYIRKREVDVLEHKVLNAIKVGKEIQEKILNSEKKYGKKNNWGN